MPTLTCPTLDRLRAFDRGEVADRELDAIASHLGLCEACAAQLTSLELSVGKWDPSLQDAPGGSAYRLAVDRIVAFPTGLPVLPEIGDTLRDYRLVEKIGQGGMGTVFKAIHTKLDKVVALKVLSGKRWNDPSAVIRFEREMKAVGRLAHPNIVQATDADDVDGVPFLVMEFVDGENLSAYVKRRGPLALPEATRLIRQAAAGLRQAHSAGVIHRDVKPSNLMLAHGGVVKLLDLGLALSLNEDHSGETRLGDSTGDGAVGSSELTSASHTVGTVDYMAPEQKRNAHTVDARADVFGLGCTFWFLLTGKPVRAGDAVVLPGSTSALPGGLPALFWKRFLATEPQDRFPTVDVAVEALRRAVSPRFGLRRIVGLPVLAALLASGVIVLLQIDRRPQTVPPEPDPSPPTRTAAPVRPKAGELPMEERSAVQLQRDWADYTKSQVRVEVGAGMTFDLVPPGELDLAKNARFVVSKPYLFGSTVVTRKQFAVFVAAVGGFKTDAETRNNGQYMVFAIDPGGTGNSGGTRMIRGNFDWITPGYSDPTDDDPVTQVSWDDAVAYCDWLSKREKKTFRLPTNAEWEWAVRAGDAGADLPDRPKLPPGIFPVQITAAGPMRPNPVGVGRTNAWGIRSGSLVQEWCRDWWGEIPTGRHTDYANHIKPPPVLRLTRGGSYTDGATTYDYRAAYLPQAGRSNIGFRVVCELP